MQDNSQNLYEYTQKIQEIASLNGIDTISKSLKNLQSQIKAETLKIAVLGQFKRGKTTLINALIGEQLLPSAIIPLTSVETVIRYGEKPRAEVIFLDGQSKEIPLKSISEYVTEPQNPSNVKEVDKVEISYPSEYLSKGILIIDTPGIGSVHKNNTDTTYQIVKDADVGIFVFSVDPPISDAEFKFLLDIKDYLGKIFFVQNKIDQVDEGDQNASLSFTKSVIENKIGIKELKYFPVSAKLALEGKLERNAEKLTKSKIAYLENAINSFLRLEKQQIFEKSIARKVLAVTEEVAGLLDLKQKTLRLPLNVLEEKIKQFNTELDAILSRKEEQDILFKGQTEKLLKERLTEDVQKFQKESLPKLLSDLEEFYFKNKNLPGTQLKKLFDEFVEEQIKKLFLDWRALEEAALLEVVKNITDKFKNETNETINKVLELSSKIFDLDLKVVDIETRLPKSKDFRFYFDEYRVEKYLDVSLVFTMLPKFLSGKYLYNKYKEELANQLDRHCGRSKYDFIRRVQEFLDDYKSEMDETQAEIIKSIKTVLAKAYEQREDKKDSVSSEIGQIQNGLKILEEIKSELNDMRY